MYIYVTLAVLPLVANMASCESTKEPAKDFHQKTTLSPPVVKASSSQQTTQLIFNPGSIWAQQSTSPTSTPTTWGEDNARYKMLLRAPYSLTKLAKSLSQGFDPFFNKDYFEPFEKRRTPVTLVAFRKNGYASRRTIKFTNNRSSEVAELQSPYNEVSHFWEKDQVEV